VNYKTGCIVATVRVAKKIHIGVSSDLTRAASVYVR